MKDNMRQEKLIFFLIIIILVSAKILRAQEPGLSYTPFALSIMDPPGDHNGPWADNAVSFHLSLISGSVGAVNGFQVGSVSNHILYDLNGTSVSGVYSKIDGNGNGSQIAGVMATAENQFHGLQVAGVYSYVDHYMFGAQIGGVSSRTRGESYGLQVAGVINEARYFAGAQVAGVTNHARDVNGAQIAGVVNNAMDLVGLQVSGVVNEADDVKGVQVAGVMNKAGVVKGAQIGVINRSEKLDGIAIGLVNISRAGHVYLSGWARSDMEYNAGFKFKPNSWWITEVTLGYNPSSDSTEYEYSLGSYAGFHIPLFGPIWSEIDFGQHNEITGDLLDFEDYDEKYRMRLELRAKVGMDFGKRIGLFAGVTQYREYSANDDYYFWDWGDSQTSVFAGMQLTVSEIIDGIH